MSLACFINFFVKGLFIVSARNLYFSFFQKLLFEFCFVRQFSISTFNPIFILNFKSAFMVSFYNSEKFL